MNRARIRFLVVLAAGGGILAWATRPPDQVSLTESCTPVGGPPGFAALLYPETFWRGQLAAVIAERDDLLAQPARRARLEAEAATSGIEGRMSRLSRDEVEDAAAKERRAAAAQSARLRRLTWLMDCEARIRVRLAEY